MSTTKSYDYFPRNAKITSIMPDILPVPISCNNGICQ